jgi:hypothetical protein
MMQWTDEELDRDRLEITDERLMKLVERVTPLIMIDRQLHRFDFPKTIEHLRRTSFIWDPTNLTPVKDQNIVDEFGSITEWATESFRELSRGTTHHTCGYYGFFKPTIAEVLAQMPDDDEITVFHIDTGDKVSILYDGEGHLTNVYWMTNVPTTREQKAERYGRRHPNQENIYE